MKKIQVGYKIYGAIDIEVPDNFILNRDNVDEVLLQQSDKDLIEGLIKSAGQIDGDAISVYAYNQKTEEEK